MLKLKMKIMDAIIGGFAMLGISSLGYAYHHINEETNKLFIEMEEVQKEDHAFRN